MSHSYAQNLIHYVYSTQGRRKLIRSELQGNLWALKSAIAKRDGVHVVAAGGVEDHAHVLLALPPVISLAKALQNVKAYSSRWMGEHGVDFKWQEGYGAFSVSASETDAVVRNIRTQAEHHRKRSFEEEFLSLLKAAGIDYDMRYVFG